MAKCNVALNNQIIQEWREEPLLEKLAHLLTGKSKKKKHEILMDFMELFARMIRAKKRSGMCYDVWADEKDLAEWDEEIKALAEKLGINMNLELVA